MRFLVVPSLLAAFVVFAACGGDDDGASRTTTQAPTASVPSEAPAIITLYFLRDGKVAPAPRSVVVGPAAAAVAIRELFEGPAAEDEGLETAIPESTAPGAIEIAGDTVIIGPTPEPTDPAARAQIVYTLTALPTVKRVSFGGATGVGRRAFENQTPPVLVESPLPGESVEPGFEVTGTANTFEATFNYELKDSSGKVLSKDFVTATSGSGTRGTFRFTVSYEIDEPQDGTLVVFELSAEDGSRIHEYEIPLQLE
jgi:hypothetical protein